MGAEFLIYAILYLVTIGGAVMVIASRDTVRSAMALVLVMLSLAAHYFYLGQEFVGAIQIIVYAGAIMVLFLFVIMLLNVREREVAPWYMRSPRFWGGALALLFFALLAIGINIFAASSMTTSAHSGEAPTIVDLVTLLMTKYSLPFLLTSILLLVAVIGAVVMGRRVDPETGEEYIPDESEIA
ncbi:NADH-quinone oxidoreductase subunit J [bacterium]|nr:NADH-quinone oxidoreductase subunit J [bacterium]